MSSLPPPVTPSDLYDLFNDLETVKNDIHARREQARRALQDDVADDLSYALSFVREAQKRIADAEAKLSSGGPPTPPLVH